MIISVHHKPWRWHQPVSLSHLVFGLFVSFYGHDSKISTCRYVDTTHLHQIDAAAAAIDQHLETRFNRDFRKYVRRVVTMPLHRRVVIVSSGIKWDEAADAPNCDEWWKRVEKNPFFFSVSLWVSYLLYDIKSFYIQLFYQDECRIMNRGVMEISKKKLPAFTTSGTNEVKDKKLSPLIISSL